MPDQLRPVQLAQADRPSGNPEHASGASGEEHAGVAVGGHHEHHYKLGEIPNPAILFWNGVIVMAVMISFGAVATRKMKKIPAGAQNFGEFLAEALMNFTRGIIGPGGEKYAPLVGTIFVFIYLSNMIAQIPYFSAPTANMSTTLALGILVFLYVQMEGIKANGIGGHLKHFMGPMPAVSPLLFLIEMISEVVKPFTLAMRLFGNIFGDDTVVIVLSTLAVSIMPKVPFIPLQFPILIMGLLVSFVQAMVFSLLTCIYISLVSHHDEDHGHDTDNAHTLAAAAHAH